MPSEMPFLLVLLAATAPELARLISAAYGSVAIPMADIRRLFLERLHSSLTLAKQAVSWCWAYIRLPIKSVRGICRFIWHRKICPSRFRPPGRINLTRNSTDQ